MIRFSILFVFAMLLQNLVAQDQLVSCHNRCTEVYTEEYGEEKYGAISRNEFYYFEARATITLQDVYFNDVPLTLQKGDTLVIRINEIFSDGSPNPHPEGVVAGKKETRGDIPAKQRYAVYKVNHLYYANVLSPYRWNGVIIYFYKERKFSAKVKTGFDVTNTEGEP